MLNQIKIFNKIKPYNKTIKVSSDKSLSIRAVLLASQAIGYPQFQTFSSLKMY